MKKFIVKMNKFNGRVKLTIENISRVSVTLPIAQQSSKVSSLSYLGDCSDNVSVEYNSKHFCYSKKINI